jgi:hypothetical protein
VAGVNCRAGATGELGGSVYFCTAEKATKHNRWALCDIALGYVGNWSVNRKIALSLPLERRKVEKPYCLRNMIFQDLTLILSFVGILAIVVF